MGQIKLANNAYTTLATGCTTSATALTVTASTTFPSVTTASGNWFYACLQDTFANLEIVKVTDVTGTTWTVTRGVGGTTGLAFPSGTVVELRVTAETLSDLLVLPGATISGGTINNTPIGGTTPSTGAFTTLSTTGAFLVAETQEIGWGVGTTGLIGSSAGNYARTYVGGTLRTEVNTTGLAVTGTLGVSGVATFGSHIVAGTNDNLSFGGLYGAGYPTIGASGGNTLTFYPGGTTAVAVINAAGVAVTGTLSATGTAAFGNGSATATAYVNGNNSGSSGGAELVVQNAGTPVIGIGNYSNLIGGAYDATATLYAVGALRIFNNGAVNATLDTNGNFGLGVTPSAWVGQRSLQLESGSAITSSDTNFYVGANYYYSGGERYNTSGQLASRYAQLSGTHVWSTAPSGTAGNPITFTQAMTLDASGNLLVGQTTTGAVQSGVWIAPNAGAATQNTSHQNGTVSGSSYTGYYYNATLIGSITQSGTTAVLYNTTSDYRLKENVQPVTSALATIAQLNPVNFTWKADGRPDTGFIAHEFQAVIPNNVTGEKDAVDADGKPVYQQMDNSGAIPYLVKAIQELKAEFDAYKVTHQ